MGSGGMMLRAISAERNWPRTIAALLALAGELHPPGDPVADVRFEPAHRARAELYGRGKLTLLDVLVQSAARQARALLHLRAAKNGGLF